MMGDGLARIFLKAMVVVLGMASSVSFLCDYFVMQVAFLFSVQNMLFLQKTSNLFFFSNAGLLNEEEFG